MAIESLIFNLISALSAGTAGNVLYEFLFKALKDALSARKPEVAGEINDVEDTKKIDATPDVQVEIVSETLDRAEHSIRAIREERLKEVRIKAIIANALLVIGVIVLLFGVGYSFFFDLSVAAALASGAGALSTVLGTVLFKFNSDANDRLDKISDGLAQIEKAKLALKIAREGIADPVKRDEAIAQIVADLSLHKTS